VKQIGNLGGLVVGLTVDTTSVEDMRVAGHEGRMDLGAALAGLDGARFGSSSIFTSTSTNSNNSNNNNSSSIRSSSSSSNHSHSHRPHLLLWHHRLKHFNPYGHPHHLNGHHPM
jgi:hypothetical protein